MPLLQSIEEFLGALERWSTEHPILGFIAMGWAGGMVAVLRMYERAGIAFSWSSFFARCAVKGGMGIFIALLAFFAWKATGWSMQWGYLVAGICGVGGSDILEALVVGLIEWMRRKAGLTPAPAPTLRPPVAPARGTPGDER